MRRQEYKRLNNSGEVHQKKTPSKSKSSNKTADFQRQKSSVSSTSSTSETPTKSGKKPKEKSSSKKSSKKSCKKLNSNSSNSSFISNDEDTQTEIANEANESNIKCEPSNADSVNQEIKTNLTTQSSEDLNESKTNLKSDTDLIKQESVPNTSVSLDSVKLEAQSNNKKPSRENRLIAETEEAAHKAAMASLAKFGQHDPVNSPFFNGHTHTKDQKFHPMQSHIPNYFNSNASAHTNGGGGGANTDTEMMRMTKFMVRINIIS